MVSRQFRLPPKDDNEVLIMLLVTALTNFACIPAIRVLYIQGRRLQGFLGVFTLVTSFMYHVCDSIDHGLYLSEGQWHRLDNVGSIMLFMGWFIYMMDLEYQGWEDNLTYYALAIVLVLQEKAPWDERYTVIPILLSALVWLVRLALIRVPCYNTSYLMRGVALLGIAVVFFVLGLDDENDPYRIFHGCWHLFVGAASYFNWQLLPPRQRDGTRTRSDDVAPKSKKLC